jgi:hypothetical protein
MCPVFERSGKTVGWINDGVIFDMAQQARAFIRGESVYNFQGRYLGRLENGFLRDPRGNAVAFLTGATSGPPMPITENPRPPVLPIPHSLPIPKEAPIPQVSSRMWSSINWEQFLS